MISVFCQTQSGESYALPVDHRQDDYARVHMRLRRHAGKRDVLTFVDSFVAVVGHHLGTCETR
jgi:hypothetical protein